MTFFKDEENMPTHVMARMVDVSVAPPADTLSTGAFVESTKAAAKTNKR